MSLFRIRSRIAAWSVVTLVIAIGLLIPSFITGAVAVSLNLTGTSLTSLYPMLVTSASLGFAGFVSLIFSRLWQARKSKFVRYQTAVGSNSIISLKCLASAMKKSLGAAQRDVQKMVDAGWFGQEAYVDLGAELLVIDPKARGVDIEMTREKSAEPADDTSEEPDVNETDAYSEIINRIGELGVVIQNTDMRSQINRIKSVTANIFGSVNENPDKLPKIRMFLDFYLPTTLKLLDAYSRLEKIDSDTENIVSAKTNIEKIIGVIADSYEQQLDRLYEAEEMDISADINVLEQMLYRDGFTTDTVYDINGANCDLDSYTDEIDDYIEGLTGGTATARAPSDKKQ